MEKNWEEWPPEDQKGVHVWNCVYLIDWYEALNNLTDVAISKQWANCKKV